METGKGYESGSVKSLCERHHRTHDTATLVHIDENGLWTTQRGKKKSGVQGREMKTLGCFLGSHNRS